MIEITIFGVPVPQPRPRVYPGGRVATDSPESAAWKAHTKATIDTYLTTRGLPSPAFPEGPLFLGYLAAFPLAKSLHRKRSPVIEHWLDGKPDLDNLAKAAMDAATRKRLKPPTSAKTANGQARRDARFRMAVYEAGRGVLWADDAQVALSLQGKITLAQDDPSPGYVKLFVAPINAAIPPSIQFMEILEKL